MRRRSLPLRSGRKSLDPYPLLLDEANGGIVLGEGEQCFVCDIPDGCLYRCSGAGCIFWFHKECKDVEYDSTSFCPYCVLALNFKPGEPSREAAATEHNKTDQVREEVATEHNKTDQVREEVATEHFKHKGNQRQSGKIQLIEISSSDEENGDVVGEPSACFVCNFSDNLTRCGVCPLWFHKKCKDVNSTHFCPYCVLVLNFKPGEIATEHNETDQEREVATEVPSREVATEHNETDQVREVATHVPSREVATEHNETDQVRVATDQPEDEDQTDQVQHRLLTTDQPEDEDQTDQVQHRLLTTDQPEPEDQDQTNVGKGYVSTKPRKRLYWTVEEEEMIKVGMERVAPEVNKNIPWKRILKMGAHVFHPSRVPADIMYKWRNMLRTEDTSISRAKEVLAGSKSRIEGN